MSSATRSEAAGGEARDDETKPRRRGHEDHRRPSAAPGSPASDAVTAAGGDRPRSRTAAPRADARGRVDEVRPHGRSDEHVVVHAASIRGIRAASRYVISAAVSLGIRLRRPLRTARED